MDDETYEQRYCAYIDILGFRQLIDRLGAGETPFDFLKNLLFKVHNPPQLQPGLLTYALTDFKVQSISDAVAISTKPSASGLLQMIQSLTELTRDLLLEGYFIRGAIVKGRLYHDRNMVFGDALVKAFNLERSVVRYPRIMVSSEVVNEACKDDAIGGLVEDYLRQSSDGPYYVHTLRRLVEFLSVNQNIPLESNADQAHLRMWQAIKDRIEERFAEATDVPRHFQNVQWFANYWNRETDPVGGRIYMRIGGPGLDPPPPLTFDYQIS